MSDATFLYIIGEPDTEKFPCWNVKIGITRDLRARLRQLQPGHHSKLVIHKYYRFGDRRSALEAEARWHRFFEDAQMCGEWFGISPEEAIVGIEESHTWQVGQ